MAAKIEDIRFKAYRTITRQDDDGEFIIRLPPKTRALLRNRRYVAIRTTETRLATTDGVAVMPEVVAAVRGLRADDHLAAEIDEAFCQLDMSLRVAVGAKGYDPQNGKVLTDKTGDADVIAVTPLARDLAPPRLASWIGFQWLLFRVERALTGDFETPICRVEPQYLTSLGIADGGVVVIEAVRGTAIRRLLAVGDRQDADSDRDAEKKLGVSSDLYMPLIFMDKSTRDQLRVEPGQVVWVRRELWSVLRRELLKVASALVLTVMGLIFSVHEVFSGWLLVEVTALSVLLMLGLALLECRNAVRSD